MVRIRKVKDFSFCNAKSSDGTACLNPIILGSRPHFCVDHLNYGKFVKYPKCIGLKMNENEKINTGIVSLKRFSEEQFEVANPKLSRNNEKYKVNCINDNSELTSLRVNENKSKSICNSTLCEFNSKLLTAVKANCKNDILFILKSIYKFDISNFSLLELKESGVFDLIITLKNERTDKEILKHVDMIITKISEYKTNSGKADKKVNNINKLKNNNQVDYATVFSEVKKKISIREELTKKENISFEADLIKSITNVKEQKSTVSGKSKMISKIDRAISLKTVNEETIKRIEKIEIRNRLMELEKNDIKDEYKSKVVSINIRNATVCRKCDIWTEGNPNKVCKEKHPEEIIYNVRAVKESWSCKTCNSTIYGINGYINSYCPICKCDTTCNLKRRSIYRLKKDPIEREVLIVRDGEVKEKMKGDVNVDII
ncbi:hypothetical protein FG379_001041 [Cryptosporidium bovis]|uniref:uncharacterized protein n=1 Tax=Cryptosporidium bovis TaxID=310047 RepID=UPI00351A443E|nr:hypothetical protein FG379_001041 [Cryptosporidium bovis]